MSTADSCSHTWRKSSHSGGSGGQCVEVAGFGPAIGIRDSKDPAAPALLLTRTAFATLLTRVKATQRAD